MAGAVSTGAAPAVVLWPAPTENREQGSSMTSNDTTPSGDLNIGRDLDLVLVGATGFVGRLTAAHLAETAGEARIALAGRDLGRLEQARASLPPAASTWELVVVDVTDAEQAAALARRTTVVCSTVGPYEQYGKALVRACAEAGTHYCDLTGEVTFVRWSIDTVGPIAERTGARIVHSCGFDSVPSDLGVLETARAAAEAGDGTLTRTVTHVRSMRGGISGGTVASMRGQVVRAGEDPSVGRLLRDSYALSPDRAAEPDRSGHADTERVSGPAALARKAGVEYDRDSGRWTAPFFMASYNTRVVRWSNARTGWSYGRDLQYSEVVDTGEGPLGATRGVATSAAVTGIMGGMGKKPIRAVLDRVLPSPGEGPSESSMKKGRFVFDIEADTTTGAHYRTRVADGRDPGYTSTAVMLGQSALALAQDDLAAVTDAGGVMTPATGLGRLLVDRLRRQGFTIETVRR